MNSNTVIFIVGPTAVGKSDVALALARLVQGEIISCDSMQIYKEVDIASGKPSKKDRKEVRHHLIDIVSVEEPYDAYRYFKDATAAIEGVLERGAAAVVTGGTGLYMKVLLDGLFDGAGRNDAIREGLKEEEDRYGLVHLYDKLKMQDPKAAQKIHPNDSKRVIRALEVCLSSHQPISELQAERQGIWGKYDITIFGLNRERKELYGRIEERVEAMFDQGLVKEIEAIAGMGLSKTARYLIGIKEIIAHLKGELDLQATKALMKLNTRHFAKRQLTWFRKEDRISWINMDRSSSVNDIVKGILEKKDLKII